VVSVTCDVGYLCANFGLPRPLSLLNFGLVYATDRRQTDGRQTTSSLNAPALGAGHNNSTNSQINYLMFKTKRV